MRPPDPPLPPRFTKTALRDGELRAARREALLQAADARPDSNAEEILFHVLENEKKAAAPRRR